MKREIIATLLLITALPVAVLAATYSSESNEVQVGVTTGSVLSNLPANENTNEAVNENVPADTNVNADTNTNTNANTNTNGNANVNGNVNANVNVEPPAPVAPIKVVPKKKKPVAPPPAPVQVVPPPPVEPEVIIPLEPVVDPVIQPTPELVNENVPVVEIPIINRNAPVQVVPEVVTPQVSAVENTPTKRLIRTAGLVRVALDEAITEAVKTYQTEILENEAVQKTANQAVAPATTAAVVALSFSVGSGWMWQYLIFFFSQPLAFFDRRRSRRWGTVFNALTRLPVDLATVRLYNTETGRIMRTRVTDNKGRFVFVVPDGNYKIDVVKSGLVFPAPAVTGQSVVHGFDGLYNGGTLEAADGVIGPNIPMETNQSTEDALKAVRGRGSYLVKHFFAATSTVFALGAVIVSPNVWTGLNLVVQIFFVLAIERLVFGNRPLKPGQVLDANDKPVPAIVRLFETSYNKLVETVVADKSGRYFFLVGPNKYYLTAEAKGSGQLKTEVYDFTTYKEPEAITAKLRLPPA